MAVPHDAYYLDDGDVIFLVSSRASSLPRYVLTPQKVEGRLFKVHKRVVTRSQTSTFATMFNLPGPSQMVGQTDETPIILEGDTSLEDFEGLMRILYPP